MILKKSEKFLGLMLERDALVSKEIFLVEENGCRDVWPLAREWMVVKERERLLGLV